MVNPKVKPCSAQLCDSVSWAYQQKVPTISFLKGNFPFSPYRSLHPTPTPGQQPAIGIFIKPDLIIYIRKFSYTKYHEFQRWIDGVLLLSTFPLWTSELSYKTLKL